MGDYTDLSELNDVEYFKIWEISDSSSSNVIEMNTDQTEKRVIYSRFFGIFACKRGFPAVKIDNLYAFSWGIQFDYTIDVIIFQSFRG